MFDETPCPPSMLNPSSIITPELFDDILLFFQAVLNSPFEA